MSTKDDIKRETQSAKEKIDEASEEIRNRANEALEEGRSAATQAVEQGKDDAAVHMYDFARAMRSAGEELQESDKGFVAGFVHDAASSLEQAANHVSNTSVDEMVGSVERFGRRNPYALVMSSMLVGVALGRFAKASSDRRRDQDAIAHARSNVAPANSLPPSNRR